MKYTTLTIIALILMSAVFMILGCSSDDETEGSKADVGPTSSIVEDTDPKGPEMIYIATGMDDLNQQKLPDYLKEYLGLVSAEVTVETPDSKWRIVADGKVYEIQYRDFNDDAEDAKVKFDAFVADFNAGDIAGTFQKPYSGD